jgi:hypothetical protein
VLCPVIGPQRLGLGDHQGRARSNLIVISPEAALQGVTQVDCVG